MNPSYQVVHRLCCYTHTYSYIDINIAYNSSTYYSHCDHRDHSHWPPCKQHLLELCNSVAPLQISVVIVVNKCSLFSQNF